MAEENINPPVSPDIPPQGVSPKKKRGKWFSKIPKDILLSPGGAVLIFFAFVMEIIDWIPIPGIDCLTWELAIELVFITLLIIIAKVPWQSTIVPFVIERIPGLSDIVPTWFLRMFF